MRIVINQSKNNIGIEFRQEKTVDTSTWLSVNPERIRRIDKFSVDKADDFLVCVDKILKRRHIGLRYFVKNAKLEFLNSSMLTERIIRAIMLGLSFNA